MTPAPDEKNGVTVHIAPGTYREQVVISTPYVRLVNDESHQVKRYFLHGIMELDMSITA